MQSSRPLLLTVDFINDIVHADGKIPTCAAMVEQHDVIMRTNAALAWARGQDFLVAHVKVGFQPNYANCPRHSPIFGKAPEYGALSLDGWGCAFHDGLHVRQDEFVIVKSRISAFYNTTLDSLLRARRIEHVILAGVSTCHAIELTAREAHDRDLRVTVLSDCCASASVEQHERTINGALARIANVAPLQAVRAHAP